MVAKINAADGAVMWARQIGGAGIQICSSIVADGTNVYVTGTYQGTLDFGNGTGAFPAAPNAVAGYRFTSGVVVVALLPIIRRAAVRFRSALRCVL